MSKTMSGLVVYESLSIVHLTGYEAEAETEVIDPPGSANYLCGPGYGMAPDDPDVDDAGILWTDYDGPGWSFTVLIASDEVDDLTKAATEAGYTVDRVESVTEPTNYGDGAGTCEILKHRDGWVILDN